MKCVPRAIHGSSATVVLFIGLLWASLPTAPPAQAGEDGTTQNLPARNTADIMFQSMCSGGGTKGILDVNFPVKISVREGLTPWEQYPELLAQEPWAPDGGPGPLPGGDVFVDIGGNLVTIEPDLGSSDPAHTYSGCVMFWMESNFPMRLAVEVTPTSPSYGTWTGSVTPEVVGPGAVLVEVCVWGENVELPIVPVGESITVAQAAILMEPPW